MVILYVFSTLSYLFSGIEDPFYYSIVVFTTSPPAGQAPSVILIKIIVMIETFLGTLLIVLLGAVISSRL